VLNLRQFTKLRGLVAVVLRAETGPVWHVDPPISAWRPSLTQRLTSRL
jgi:hypothetical protein